MVAWPNQVNVTLMRRLLPQAVTSSWRKYRRGAAVVSKAPLLWACGRGRFHSAQVVGADVLERAPVASRPPGVAHLAPQADEVEVGGAIDLRREQGGEVIMGGFGGHAFRPQAKAAADGVDVRIDREGRLTQREEQNDGGCLWAHPLQAQKPGFGFCRGQPAEELEIPISPLGGG